MNAKPAAGMRLGVIWAQAANGVIGKDGALPWHLPEDLAHFKQVTLGAPVIMGRKTWDSLPPRFRPLPGRRNIVVTHQAGWSAPGAERAASVPEAVALCADAPAAWVIGGAQIYAQALPLAEVAEITLVHAAYEGDAFAPALDAGWTQEARREHPAADGRPALSFTRWRRASAAA